MRLTSSRGAAESAKVLQNRASLFQNQAIVALAERPVERREERMRLLGPAPTLPEAREPVHRLELEDKHVRWTRWIFLQTRMGAKATMLAPHAV